MPYALRCNCALMGNMWRVKQIWVFNVAMAGYQPIIEGALKAKV